MPAQGTTVLVIDDEEPILDLVEKVLTSEGYGFVGALSGSEGLSALTINHEEIGAVVLDVTMPDMSGEEVLKTILERDPNMPVLVMSGHNSDRVSSFVDGTLVRFLKKPFRPSELIESIEAVLE
ncbi:MAG: response regulator [Gammaproteobacteria bacterium]|nr:response regulator [Gammaproteobacteria bacterium]